MLQNKKTVLTEDLQLNETEKNLLASEEEKYGAPLKEMPKDKQYAMCFACSGVTMQSFSPWMISSGPFCQRRSNDAKSY